MDFITWCTEKNLAIPTVDEHRERTGVRGQYPDGYVRSQYPDGYFAPTTATWKLDLKNAKGIKHVKDSGNTPL